MYNGMGDHTQKMSYIAKEFFDRGYDVIGYDAYGFGHSEGVRGSCTSFDKYIEDGN